MRSKRRIVLTVSFQFWEIIDTYKIKQLDKQSQVLVCKTNRKCIKYFWQHETHFPVTGYGFDEIPIINIDLFAVREPLFTNSPSRSQLIFVLYRVLGVEIKLDFTLKSHYRLKQACL